MLYLENAKEHFKSGTSIIPGYNSEVSLYHRLSEIIPDRIDVDNLILAFKIVLKEAEQGGVNIVPYIGVIPKYVRQCASSEFSHEFREKYIKEILGIDKEPLPDVDYGYKEVSRDVIDISNKDRGEVFAALYNASVPVGNGFMQYNPFSWDAEMGSYYFDIFGEKEGNAINFSYVVGRPLKCTFEDNLVYVSGYNFDNEPGLAQRVISTCKNISKTVDKNKSKIKI